MGWDGEKWWEDNPLGQLVSSVSRHENSYTQLRAERGASLPGSSLQF